MVRRGQGVRSRSEVTYSFMFTDNEVIAGWHHDNSIPTHNHTHIHVYKHIHIVVVVVVEYGMVLHGTD